MTIWRWAVLAGLVAMAISIGFGTIPDIHACGLPGEPILNFEFVRTPAEVATLFPEGCRAEHVVAQRTGLWLDALSFIPSYSAFLLLSLAGLRREGGSMTAKLAGLAMAMALVAAICDEFEGVQLFRLLADLPGTQSTIDLLMPAVRTKFGLLSLVVSLAGWLHFRQPGWRKVAGAVITLGGLWSFAALFLDRNWMMQGSALAWLVLLGTNAVLAARKAA